MLIVVVILGVGFCGGAIYALSRVAIETLSVYNWDL
jgi:hypothetical protein